MRLALRASRRHWLAAAVGLALGCPAPAALSFSARPRAIRNATSGLCLSVLNASRYSKARLYWDTCDGRPSQAWRFDYRGGGAYAIHPGHADGLCLDQSGPGIASTIYVYQCHYEDNQRWHADRREDGEDYLLRTVATPDMCLATAFGETSHAWTCNWGDGNQTLSIEQ